MKFYLLVIGCMFLFVACKQNNNKSGLYTGKKIPYTDSTFPKGLSDVAFLQTCSKLMGLPRLDSGIFNSYMRVWVWDGSDNYLMNLELEQGKSNASVFKIGSIDSTKVNYFVIDSVWQNLNPIDGWDIFKQKIDVLHITELQGGSAPKDLPAIMTSMSSVQIEMNNKGKYKMVQYFEPNYFRTLNDGTSLVNDFLILCKKQFGINLYFSSDQFYQPDHDSIPSSK